jgi:hypothetical protein
VERREDRESFRHRATKLEPTRHRRLLLSARPLPREHVLSAQSKNTATWTLESRLVISYSPFVASNPPQRGEGDLLAQLGLHIQAVGEAEVMSPFLLRGRHTLVDSRGALNHRAASSMPRALTTIAKMGR